MPFNNILDSSVQPRNNVHPAAMTLHSDIQKLHHKIKVKEEYIKRLEKENSDMRHQLYNIEHGCRRKVRFTSYKAAANVIRSYQKKGQMISEDNIYQCGNCEGWHIGHQKGEKE